MAKKVNEIKVEYKAVNTQFNEAIKDINAEVTTLNKKFKLSAEEMKRTASETEKLESVISKLQDELTLAGKKTEATNKAYEEAVRLMGENSKEAQTWANKLLDAQKNEAALKNAIADKTDALKRAQSEQEAYNKSVDGMKLVLDKAGREIGEFADVLGDKTVQAFKEGKGTSKEMEVALSKLGKELLETGGDADLLDQALKGLGDGADFNSVVTDTKKASQGMKDLEQSAEKASNGIGEINNEAIEITGLDSAKDLFDDMTGAIGEAFDKLSEFSQGALELGQFDTTIELSMDLDETGVNAVKDAVQSVKKYGYESEEALEAVRKQFQLNSDKSDEFNKKIADNAAMISKVYSEIDMSELIQETSEFSKQLNISQEDAMALYKNLLDVGFPPGEIDIISEYGNQLERAGYTTEEIQALFASGLDTGTWNIDNLMDGLKEGRIKMAEFGSEVDDTTKKLIEGTGISTTELQKWGKAIAKGGDGGKKAMEEMVTKLASVKDETKKNELGVKFFGR